MSAPVTEKGIYIKRSWMRKAFPDQLEIKGTMKTIVQCKPTRPLKLYASDPTFGTAEIHATPQPYTFVRRAETGVTISPGPTTSTSNAERFRKRDTQVCRQ